MCGNKEEGYRLICVPKDQQCPVSAIQFAPMNTFFADQNRTVNKFNTSHDFVVTRGGDPLVDITIQEGRVCLNTETQPLTQGRNLFKYFTAHKKECKDGFDERYTL